MQLNDHNQPLLFFPCQCHSLFLGVTFSLNSCWVTDSLNKDSPAMEAGQMTGYVLNLSPFRALPRRPPVIVLRRPGTRPVTERACVKEAEPAPEPTHRLRDRSVPSTGLRQRGDDFVGCYAAPLADMGAMPRD
jgi:hypothetical protein